MKGYWGKPEATAEAIPDGWFRTGDLATMDDEGYFTIVDRKKDMILRGGMNVYPREVEEVIYTHPDVVEVAVVGMPDELMGEQVGAAVALREGATTTPEDIIAYTKERIAAYKYPRTVWVVPTLPKGPTGKILRREVHPPARGVSASPSSRMPSASLASDAPLGRPGDRWRMPGLVLLGVWAALFVVAIALWVRVAFLSGTGTGDRGLVRLVGAPFVLVALGLLWWAWWSVRALRRGRREGWTLLLVLGGVSVVQAVLTGQAVLASSSGTGGAGSTGPPREIVGGLLVVIALGLVSVVVAVLARRSWAAADAAAGRRRRRRLDAGRRRQRPGLTGLLALAHRGGLGCARLAVDDERRAQHDGEPDELPRAERLTEHEHPEQHRHHRDQVGDRRADDRAGATHDVELEHVGEAGADQPEHEHARQRQPEPRPGVGGVVGPDGRQALRLERRPAEHHRNHEHQRGEQGRGGL